MAPKPEPACTMGLTHEDVSKLFEDDDELAFLNVGAQTDNYNTRFKTYRMLCSSA